MSLKYGNQHKRKFIFGAIALSFLVSGCSPVTTPAPDVSTSATKAAPSETATKAPKPTETVKPSETKATPSKAPTKESKPATGTASQVLSALKVNDEMSSGYQRELFGSGWVDVDNNNCDTREDTLALHMTNVSKSGNCEVVSGTLVDPYTGETVQFSKDGKGGGIDIDHVVALSAGWKTGMATASTANREAFANDPLNLLPVDAGLNRYKSDKDASEWIPSQGKTRETTSLDANFDCPYVARQIAVKAKYGMWVTTLEKARMTTVLKECPEVNIPKDSEVTAVVGTNEGAESAVESKAPETKPNPAPKATKSASNGKSDPDMGSCGKAKSAGYGPYHKGDIEYGYYRDGDGDGTVCE